jgi:hypothetical protein
VIALLLKIYISDGQCSDHDHKLSWLQRFLDDAYIDLYV